jgi:hypothetical protein
MCRRFAYLKGIGFRPDFFASLERIKKPLLLNSNPGSKSGVIDREAETLIPRPLLPLRGRRGAISPSLALRERG